MQLKEHLVQILGIQMFKQSQSDHNLAVTMSKLIEVGYQLIAVHPAWRHAGYHAIIAMAERPVLTGSPGLCATAKVEHGSILKEGSDQPWCVDKPEAIQAALSGWCGAVQLLIERGGFVYLNVGHWNAHELVAAQDRRMPAPMHVDASQLLAILP